MIDKPRVVVAGRKTVTPGVAPSNFGLAISEHNRTKGLAIEHAEQMSWSVDPPASGSNWA
jgi:hypothetical protein